jgi:hypothetical protein
LDRRITVEDLAYSHGDYADGAGSGIRVRLMRSPDHPDRVADRI